MIPKKTATDNHSQEWFIGIMSGTSLDGMDMAAVCFDSQTITQIITDFEPYPLVLRQKLSFFANQNNYNPVAFGETDKELGEFYASTLIKMSQKPQFSAKLSLNDCIAIGNHGQTIRHHPQGKSSFTWQMGDPHPLCLATQKPICYDFRRMDVAAGGQGAPLAPLFHEYLHQNPNKTTIVINLGGIANITILANTKLACDTGPANTLLDQWAQKHLGTPYDQDGAWGQAGQVDQELLLSLLQHPYLAKPCPKSTGPEEFHLTWLENTLQSLAKTITPQDVQCTLYDFTAQTLINHIFAALEQMNEQTNSQKSLHPNDIEIDIAGGGVKNHFLMERIKTKLKSHGMTSFKKHHLIDPDFMEAAAFAWLARERFYTRALNTQPFTGASRPVVLGAMIHP